MSHAVDRSNDKAHKMLLVDVKKAHLNSECTEDVFIELPQGWAQRRTRLVNSGAGSADSDRRRQRGKPVAQTSWMKSAS